MKSANDIRLLLVDDDEINRLVATKFLKKWGIAASIVETGQEALELISGKGFNLILMDLHMPGMDGIECTARIRAMDDPYFKNIPIIVFSAAYTIDTKKKAQEYGMTDFMYKPFRQEELMEKIAAYTGVSFSSVV